jgi:hypothetical protein
LRDPLKSHAFYKGIIALVGLTECRPNDAAELATRINRAIENGEVLWRLHGTVVPGLGTYEVVKALSTINPRGRLFD